MEQREQTTVRMAHSCAFSQGARGRRNLGGKKDISPMKKEAAKRYIGGISSSSSRHKKIRGHVVILSIAAARVGGQTELEWACVGSRARWHRTNLPLTCSTSTSRLTEISTTEDEDSRFIVPVVSSDPYTVLETVKKCIFRPKSLGFTRHSFES